MERLSDIACLPNPLADARVDEGSQGAGDVAGDGQVAREVELHVGGRDWYVRRRAVEGDVAKLVLPERRDGNHEVPRHHRGHAQIAEGDPVSVGYNSVV